jgi:hypothetical protein
MMMAAPMTASAQAGAFLRVSYAFAAVGRSGRSRCNTASGVA